MQDYVRADGGLGLLLWQWLMLNALLGCSVPQSA